MSGPTKNQSIIDKQQMRNLHSFSTFTPHLETWQISTLSSPSRKAIEHLRG